MPLNRLRTIRLTAEETPFSENTLRWWIFNSPENGFDRVIRRVGRRIYLNLDELEVWVDNHAEMGSGDKRAER